jgi:hypothetical protein|mmetsp:Transcript_4708/g.7525  ORF Transcript_4708/g.7525 Transcript_4708/m.7525 type:complete len:102 (+) Transcript_4708:1527-1832(+)
MWSPVLPRWSLDLFTVIFAAGVRTYAPKSALRLGRSKAPSGPEISPTCRVVGKTWDCKFLGLALLCSGSPLTAIPLQPLCETPCYQRIMALHCIAVLDGVG